MEKATPDSTQAYFEAILNSMMAEEEEVTAGPMMTAPGIKYRNKVFAFHHESAMTFKLGKEFDPAAFGVSEWTYLSPFKHKPPMRAWIILSGDYREKWADFAALALEKMKRGKR